jgi:hypothetical protein
MNIKLQGGVDQTVNRKADYFPKIYRITRNQKYHLGFRRKCI